MWCFAPRNQPDAWCPAPPPDDGAWLGRLSRAAETLEAAAQATEEDEVTFLRRLDKHAILSVRGRLVERIYAATERAIRTGRHGVVDVHRYLHPTLEEARAEWRKIVAEKTDGRRGHLAYARYEPRRADALYPLSWRN